jgi:hypothetical protein
MIRVILLAALLPALPAHAQPAPLAKPGSGMAKPAVEVRIPDRALATHYWYDGGRRRGLLVDENLRADFVEGKAVPADRGRPGAKAMDAGDGGLPPGAVVFRDADSPAVKRALPGGVIVTTRTPTDAEALGRLLAPRGLVVSRPLDATGSRWLVDSPPGIASLELANQLHESGEFAAAEPNWWRERALK